MAFKEIHDGLVGTEKAKEITKEHRLALNSNWDIDRPTKADSTEQSFHFYAPLETEEGITERAMIVSAYFTFGKRTFRQKLHIKLEYNGKTDEKFRRIIDLDSRRPVNWKGKESDKNWPHVHVGAEERHLLHVDKNLSTIDVSEHARIFEKYANVTFKTEVLDPNELVLK